ncbi:MAG: hypothetical protein AVDCRST_MAG90-2970, partial [uncultured Microvirga sp.]
PRGREPHRPRSGAQAGAGRQHLRRRDCPTRRGRLARPLPRHRRRRRGPGDGRGARRAPARGRASCL